jgi:hypothetical protein
MGCTKASLSVTEYFSDVVGHAVLRTLRFPHTWGNVLLPDLFVGEFNGYAIDKCGD